MNRGQLREQFALHAPPPPEWFEPILQKAPARMPSLYQAYHFFTEEEIRNINTYYEDENGTFYNAPFETKELEEKVRDYIKKREENYQKIKDWTKSSEMERLIQWTRYYANTMAENIRGSGEFLHAIVHFRNDPSVGLFSESFYVEIPEFENEYREDTRIRIQALFNDLHGDSTCTVYFSDEGQ